MMDAFEEDCGDFAQAFTERGWDVPTFETRFLDDRRTRYALVIPVVNEGERIRNQLAEQHAQHIDRSIDTLIVDGGSTDGSLDDGFLRENGISGSIVKTGPGTLSAQLRCAYALALVRGYEGIVTIDGNGKDSVESILAFIGALNEGIDYAQASRFRRGGKGVNTPIARLLAIRLVHAPILSAAGRRWLTDTTQGFRAYSARYLLDPRVSPFRRVFADYELLAYLSARAGQLGYRVTEIPTIRTYPSSNEIPTKIKSMSAHLSLLNVLRKTLSGDFAPPR